MKQTMSTRVAAAFLLAAAAGTAQAQSVQFDRKGQIEVIGAIGRPIPSQIAYTGLPEARLRKAQFMNFERNLKSAVIEYRGWAVGENYAYTARFWWELDMLRLKTPKRHIVFDEIRKYPDLVERYKAVAPTRVSYTIDGAFWRDNGAEYSVHLRAAEQAVVFGASGATQLPRVPFVPTEWVHAMSSQFGEGGRYGSADKTNVAEMARILPHTTGINSWHTQPLITLSVEWPDADIEEIGRLYDLYERGEAEPGPVEQVARKTAALPQLPRYPQNDEWAAPVEIPIRIELDRDLNGTSTAEGVVELKGRVSGPAGLIKKGRLQAEGYDQEFDIGADGRFARQVVLKSGANRIQIGAAGKSVEQRITLSRAPTRLRATLTWNTGGSDIDLHMVDPKARTVSYRNKSAGGMQLDVDNTRGYGPENIYVQPAEAGEYTVKVHNYRGGAGTQATVYVFIDEQLKEVKRIRFDTSGQMVTVGNYKL